MGIRGLTTFIQNRSHMYMDSYELHDTKLVIDGNAIACQLYKWHTSSNDCFGGDYDKYGKVIKDFFDLLTQCNVVPYVVFDGGYEKRKIATVISRMKNKVKSANLLNPVTETSISVFPLFLRKTFEDVVTERGIRKVRCDFEGDTETANIARALDCPVLSYDSDYFIFDTLYIPFANFEMGIKRAKDLNNKTYKYISCKIYRVDKFLKSFDGLQKSSLPVLAVLLGNDYVKRGVFTMFYQNLKMQKCHGNQSDQQKRIKSLLIWLQNETIESALKQVLSRYKKAKRKNIMDKIHQAIKGYNTVDSKYLHYLDALPKTAMRASEIDLTYVNSIDDEEISTEEIEEEYSEDESSSDQEIILVENDISEEVPLKFLEKFRQCIYPPSFMDILLQNKYYCVPQIEDNSLEHSHTISFDILSAIHKILTSRETKLLCIGRKGSDHIGKVQIPLCDKTVPIYNDIETLSEYSAKTYMYNILDIDKNFDDFLDECPRSWHIFLLAINYFSKNASPGLPLICSLILCKLILNHIDKKIGFHRSSKTVYKKFGTLPENQKVPLNASTVQNSLENITQTDSMSCLKALIGYFEMDYKRATNYKAFERNLAHSISQFQSCLMHIGHLNILFDFPYSNFFLTDCLNCTFIYNLTNNLNKRTNLDEYLKILLKDSPSVLYSLNFILKSLQKYINFDITSQVNTKRRKKKKKKVNPEEEIETTILEPDDDDDDAIFDPNNKYSLLVLP